METERHIEKLLRAFSKKRKADAGADLELHPANRRLLQDEVARSTKKSDVAGGSFWQMLFGSIPRVAVSLTVTSALILLTVNFFVWQPAEHKSQSQAMLAQNKSSADKDLKKAEMSAPPTAPAVVTVQPASPIVNAPVTAPAPAPEIATAKSKPTEAVVLEERKGVTKEMDRAEGMDVATAPSVNAPAVASQNVGGGFGGGGGGGRGRGGPAGGRGGGFGGARQDGNATLVANGTTSSVNRDVGPPASRTTSPAPTEATTLAFDKAATSSLAVAEAASQASTAGAVRFNNLAVTGDQNVAQAASQSFYRLRTADQAAGGVKVLDSFSVEQSGDQITVVDADGSKYSGIVQIAAVKEESGTTVKSTPPVVQSPRLAAAAPQRRQLVATNSAVAFSYANQQQIGSQNYYFRVTGTNRTLNQAVVFSGNLMASTNTVLLENTLNSRAVQQVQPQVIQQLPLSNSRITGRASVGGKSDIEINAAPVSP